MVSEKQLAANRRNAQKSTGPGPEGKANSSRNNLRHGLTGHISLLPTEDREAHDAFCNELIDSFNPKTPMERQLAQSIAEDSWRLNRACAIENNMFALGHQHERREVQIALADAATFQTQAAAFNLLSIYEQRINRNLQRNMKLLKSSGRAQIAARSCHGRSKTPRTTQSNERFTLPARGKWLRLFSRRNQPRHRSRQPPESRETGFNAALKPACNAPISHRPRLLIRGVT